MKGLERVSDGAKAYDLRFIAVMMMAWIALCTIAADWGLPNDHSWSNDNPFPPFALELEMLRDSGSHKYPYAQAMIDRALYTPTVSNWQRSGRLKANCELGELECYEDPVEQVGDLLRISRLRSMLLGLLLALAAGRLSFRLYADRLAARMTVILLLLCETLVFFAQLGNLDIPMSFWFVLSMLAFERLVRHGRWLDDVAFGLLGALALATKDGIVGAYVLVAVAIIACHARRKPWLEPEADQPKAAWGGRSWIRVVWIAVALLIPYAWIMNIVGNPLGFQAHVAHWIGGEGVSGYNQGYSGWIDFGDLVLRRARESVGWPMYLFLLAGAAYGVRVRPRETMLVLIPFVSYLLFTLVPIRFVYTRFLLPLLPLLAVPAGLLASRLWNLEGALRPAARASLFAVTGYSFLYTLAVLLGMRADTRIAAEAWLAANAPIDAVVHGIGAEYALPRMEWLGLDEHDRFDWQEIEHGYPSASDPAPAYIVLTSKSFRGAVGWRAELRDALLDEELGYAIVFDEQSESWLEQHLPGAVMEARVSPRIVILQGKEVASAGARSSVSRIRKELVSP